MALKSEAMPNLKIEVANNDPRDEAMDVDDEGSKEESLVDEASELEEGEISDSKDDDDSPAVRPSATFKSTFTKSEKEHEPEFERRYENKSGAFVTGIDIFSKEGQEKLNERAKRFGLDPTKVRPLAEAQLHQLYESLGLQDDESPLEKQGHRLDALHIRGTDDLSTQDVFDYFKDYGPASIEWINDVSCLTQPGKQMMEEVVLVEEEDGEMEAPEKATEDEAVPASEINAPIPPGMWRLGAQCLKAKCILLRFATRADRKPKQAEKLSDYYKKYGNPNYGGFVDPDDPLLLDAPVQQRVILRSNRSNPPPPPPTVHSSESESEHNSSSDSEDDADKWRKKLKRPHMRMYADDEEIKVKKRKLNARLGKKTSPPPAPTVDLRSRLSNNVRPSNKGSVWSRLEASKVVETAESVALPSDGEWSSDDDKSVVVTTVKSQVSDLRHALSSSSRKSDGDDLRSRLNKKKSRRGPKSTPPYEKSPLRIEINNDEYVQSHGSSSEAESAASGSQSSDSSSDSESGSSSGSSSSSSESSSSSGEEDEGGEEAEKSS
ncbi:hypothetical protein B566_EDAN004576 [Ephemera danica]|nr:hypothetical protein B566_EDAN004576 [Ephemera danica]